METPIEKQVQYAQALLTLLDAATFPGSQRRLVMEVAEWLEKIAAQPIEDKQ